LFPPAVSPADLQLEVFFMGKQELRSLALGAACVFMASSAAAFTSPRDGGPLPQGYFDAKAKDPRAFTAPHAWVQKAERLRTEREAYLARAGSLPNFAAGNFAVADTFRVPVLPAYYSDQAAVPYSAALMQTQLFGANPTGNVTQYYHEVSYNQLTVTGDVYAWTHLLKDPQLLPGQLQRHPTAAVRSPASS
jgi:hypothetical protein